MRYREIRVINESIVSADLQQIGQEVKKDPAKAEYARKYLTALLNYTNKIISQASATAENVHEDVALNPDQMPVDNLIAELNLQIDQICKVVKNCDPIIKGLKQKIVELKNTVFQAGVQSSEKETQKYFSDLNRALKPLVEKVSGDSKIRESVKTTLEGWFASVVLRDRKISKEEMLGFLHEAANGHIIDMKSLVKKSNGNLQDFVNPKYKTIFELFKKALFDYKPGGTGANLGPAEVAITLLGNPAEKANVGDIMVDGVMYELKGGRGGKGGRLNGKEVLKPTSGGQFIKKFFEDRALPISPMIKSSKGKMIPKYNWNPTGIERLNQDLLTLKKTKAQRIKLIYDFLLGLWKHMITNYAEINDFDNKIQEMIDTETGTIDPQMAILNTTKLLYQSYQLSDGQVVGKIKKMNILIINSETLNYIILRQEKDIDKVKIVNGITWNDANSSASPQLYIG
jgi:hypothetical protein